MKKLFFITLVAGASMFLTGRSNAQVGLGGFPKSMTLGNTMQVGSATITLERPDYEKLSREDATKGEGSMFRTGITLPAGIDFHKSGQWTYLDNGEKIWRLSVEIPDAQGIVLMYEQFHLPKGVTLYVTNQNGKQVLGAYTDQHNPKSDHYSNEPVVGSVVNIEMNFTPDADISQVKYLINSAGAMYRGLENEWSQFMETQANPPQYPGGVYGGSAVCQVNAICPQGDDIADLRKSVARILIASSAAYNDIGFCSGTLINSTENTAANCRRLFATASHCDGNNARTDDNFQYWQFRFNYLTANCDGTGAPSVANSPVLTEGAKFVSRSNYPSMGQASENKLVQDFLMLELNDDFAKIPDAWMAGWSKKASYTNEELLETYNKFIGFHHPGGDAMKLAVSETIDPFDRFNQTVVPATHWGVSSQVGGSAGGSSGSALFDIFGRVIGVLSGGPNNTCSDGRQFGVEKVYSKFSYGWDNEFDQTTFPANAGPQSRLKEVLDPANTGYESVNPTPVSVCDGAMSVKINKLSDNSFTVFPNPSSNGIFNVRFNLKEVKNVQINVINALGQKMITKQLNGMINQTQSVDCSSFAAGVYMVQLNIDGAQVTKMISISK